MKKILAMVLSIALVATMAITGSIAYLQDSDEAVNVMTLGNVEIDQIEQEWNEDHTALQDFTQEKPLYPYVGNLAWKNIEEGEEAYRSFAMNNVVDKYVSVKNTGKSDAYVRTIIALEMGDYTYDEFNMIGVSINAENGSQFKFPGAWNWTDDFAATIDGKTYNIMVAVHEDAIEPGETTIPSLNQVYMTKESTNETCEKLDGNKNGTYDILVLSQAVQSMGFEDKGAQVALDTAFGDVTAANVQTWFGDMTIPTAVSTAEELAAALENGGEISLSNNITLDEAEMITIAAGTTATLNLNGKTITGGMQEGSDAKHVYPIENRGTLTLSGGTVEGRGVGNYGTMIIEDGTYNAIDTNGGGAVWNYAGGNVTINGGTFTSAETNSSPAATCVTNAKGATMTIKGGTFTANADWTYAIINDGTLTIDNAAVSGEHGAIANNGTIVVNGGTYTVPNSTGGHVVYVSDGEITINGGTFEHKQVNAPACGNVVVYVVKDNTAAKATINGGTYKSDYAAFAYTGMNIDINAGTFESKAATVYQQSTNNGIAEFVADGHEATTGSNGSVTVK